MENQICAVTGANGLVGSHLCAHLEKQGFKVWRLQRRLEGKDSKPFDLGGEVDPDILKGAHSLVHCAYDMKAVGWDPVHRINVVGSEKLIRSAVAAGVQKLIFISTVSAFEGCRSDYGRGKLMVEQRVHEAGGISLRPGLIYGDPMKRGIFGALERITRLPLLPVFGSGNQPFVLTHIEDLSRVIEALLQTDLKKVKSPLVVAHPEQVPFKAILKKMAAHQGRTPRFIPVPGVVALSGLKTLEHFGLRPPFKSDSLVTLLNPNHALDFASTQEMKFQFRRYLDS